MRESGEIEGNSDGNDVADCGEAGGDTNEDEDNGSAEDINLLGENFVSYVKATIGFYRRDGCVHVGTWCYTACEKWLSQMSRVYEIPLGIADICTGRSLMRCWHWWTKSPRTFLGVSEIFFLAIQTVRSAHFCMLRFLFV